MTKRIDIVDEWIEAFVTYPPLSHSIHRRMGSIAGEEIQERETSNVLSLSPGSSGKVQVDDLESGSWAICRICLESTVDGGDDLISPCLCRGTQLFVHHHCLDSWRSIREGFAFSNCTTCNAQYHMRYVEGKPWWNLKHRLLVARDAFIMFLVVQTWIGTFGSLASSFMNRDGNYWNVFNDTWEHMLSSHPFFFYHTHHHQKGTPAVFLLAGIIGLIHQLWVTDSESRVEFRNCCLGWIVLACFVASRKALIALALTLLSIFTAFGVVYGFFVAKSALHMSWQRHRDTLTKRSLREVHFSSINQHSSSHKNYTCGQPKPKLKHARPDNPSPS